MIRLAKAGRPKTAVTMSDAAAAKLKPTTLRRSRRSAAPPRSSVSARSSIAAANAGGADFEPGQQRLAAPPETEHALGRRHPAAIRRNPIRRARDRPLAGAAAGQDAQAACAGFDDDVVARARRAVEIDRRAARRASLEWRICRTRHRRIRRIRCPRRRAHRQVLRRARSPARRTRARSRARRRRKARPIARRAATSRRLTIDLINGRGAEHDHDVDRERDRAGKKFGGHEIAARSDERAA